MHNKEFAGFRHEKQLLILKFYTMKTIKSVIAIILFSNLFFSCTPDNTVEEGINNSSIEVVATGGEQDGDIDDEQDGE